MKIKQIGMGEFGVIYEGVEGKEAVDFLLLIREGEVRNAFTRSDIGSIDLVWGKEGDNGYGLAHFQNRKGALKNLRDVVEKGTLQSTNDNSVILIKRVVGSGGTAIVQLDWKGEPKRWIITSY